MTEMRANHVKRALQSGEVQSGTWIHTLGAPQLPQILATAGFDFVYIDMEHSSFSIETVGRLCTTALYAGLVPIVRPPGPAHHLLSRPMDSGAMGILMPHVDTAADAEAAVRAVKFPPLGDRGSQPPNQPTGFAQTDAAGYMSTSNDETMVMVQIESAQAVANLDSILAVPGIDGAVVGRGDLAAELGVGGQRNHPEVLAAVDSLLAACERNGKIPGLLVQQVDEAREWIDRGVRMIAYASETIILRNAAQAALQAIRDKPSPG
jgi:2-keto-3-deoxy-L-rhamnonate aldolase RhmA